MNPLTITIPITKRRKVVLSVDEAKEVQRQLNEIFPPMKNVPEQWVGNMPMIPPMPEPTYSSGSPLPPLPTSQS